MMSPMTSRVCGVLLAVPMLAAAAALGQTSTVPCSDPDGCPDLTVLISQMVIQTLQFKSTDCALVEGMISNPGKHKLLRFSTEYPNHGPGDLIVGAPSAHPEWFEWSPCHQHYHFREYADYRLWTPSGYQAWSSLRQSTPASVLSRDLLAQNPNIAKQMIEGDKRAFCVNDSVRFDASAPAAKYTSCFSNEGISVGWADLYPWDVEGQWIDITNAAAGNYVVEVEVNAEHLFVEANYANNSTAVPVVIPKPGNGR
jgi:hypothetical protein